MASCCSELSSKNFNHCGPTMLPDTVQPPSGTVGPGHLSADKMYHDDAAQADGGVNGHGSGSIMAHPSTPAPGDIANGKTCTCFMYGMCPLAISSESWERVVGEAGGKGDAEKKMEDGQPLDYMYHYHMSGYLPFPHVYTASAPHHMSLPAAAAAPATSPLILLTPATSSPSSTKSIPNSLTSQKNDGEEVHEDHGTRSHEEMNGHSSPAAALQPPLAAVPQPVPANGTYSYSFLDDSKAGVFGADGCLYSFPTAHNGMAADHSSPIKAPVYYPYMHQDPATFIPTPSYIPDTSMASPVPSSSISSSTPSSAFPISSHIQSSALNGRSVFKSDGILYYNHYQHPNLPIDMFGKPQLLVSTKTEGKMCLEDLWTKHMGILFKHLPDQWVLSPLHPRRKMSTKWFSFRDVAKVRFYCKTCNDGWTSMYGVVVFHYRWNKKMLQGQILYKVVGQKCGGACSSEVFELPLWYPEEAQKVITNLYYKIASQFYDLVTPQYIRTRRYGRPAAHHNRNLCEGCISGLCKVDPVASNTNQ
ncbi:uncharacterized protein LOC135115504 isoform X1 [Scylla paramamosain]